MPDRGQRAAMTEGPRTGLPDPASSDGSDLLNVRCGRALLALLLVVAHLRALGERLEAAALDRGVMDEKILAAFIGRDEAEALVVVEPLNGACCHISSLRCCVTAETRRAVKQQPAETPYTCFFAERMPDLP